jgi:hypothetical protein
MNYEKLRRSMEGGNVRFWSGTMVMDFLGLINLLTYFRFRVVQHYYCPNGNAYIVQTVHSTSSHHFFMFQAPNLYLYSVHI